MVDDLRELRRALLAEVQDRGGARTGPVAEAMLAVPRHVFVPEVPVQEAYQDEAIVTRRNADGLPTSSSSQPTIMALMLDQLGVSAGHRVLEIGAGTGYNAALLAHLIGPTGRVVSVDIDPVVVERARANLAVYPSVTVICADGADGFAARAPYDRIIATVGVWDLAPAWSSQLAPGGRIVIPLDLRGAQVSVALEREGDAWVSRSVVPCGFMRLRGGMAGPDQVRVVAPGLIIGLPDGRAVDAAALAAALAGPPAIRPSGVAGDDPTALEGLRLWLAIREPRSCGLSDEGGSPVLDRAPLQGQGFRATLGIADGAGIAVLERGAAVDAAGYGPAGDRLAAELTGHVRAWAEAGRPGTERLRLAVYPRDVPVPEGGVLIEKIHTRLVVHGFEVA